MVVGIDIRVESVEGASEINLPDKSLIDQNVQITVDRSHAQMRELFLQVFVDPIGGRVCSGFSKKFEDSVSLSAPFVSLFLSDGVVSGFQCTPDSCRQSNLMVLHPIVGTCIFAAAVVILGRVLTSERIILSA